MKHITKLAIIIAFILPSVLVAQVFNQSQVIQAPFGGFVYATSTSPTAKLNATTTPFFQSASFGTGTFNIICLTGDICRSTWPSGGGGNSFAFPFTVNTGYNSTTTALGFLNGFFSTASSTVSGPLKVNSTLNVTGTYTASGAIDTQGTIFNSSGNDNGRVYVSDFLQVANTLFTNGDVIANTDGVGSLGTSGNRYANLWLATSTNGCAQFASTGQLYSTGSSCGSGSGSSSVGPINTLQASGGSGGFIATGTPQLTVGNILATSSADNIFRGPVRLPNGLVNGLLKLTGTTNLISNAVLGTDYVSGSGTSGNCVKWNASNALGDFGAPCSSGGGGTGTVSTSTVPTIGNLAYWTSNGYPSLLGSVATSAPTVSAPITYSGTLGSFVGGVGGTFGCTSASAGVTGCLTGTDWSTFNNKQATISSTWPIVLTGSALSWGGLATSSNLTNSRVHYSTGVNTFADVATSTLAVGSSLSSSGALGYQIGGTNSSLSINTANTNTWSVLQNFLYSSTTGYASFQNSSTTNLILSSAVNIGPGCASFGSSGQLQDSGTLCGTVSSVGLSDVSSSLTIGSTPITSAGTITAALNLAHTNTWSVLQNFNYSSSTVYSTFQTSSTTIGFFGTLNIPNLGIPTGSFLAVDPTGKVIATTTPAGGGLSSYDAWTHSTIFTPNSATTTKISIGTTTPYYSFTVASSTGPQIALSDGTSGVSQWTMRNAGGNLYFASTTIQGNATTTTSAISIIGSTGYIGIGSTTPFGTFSIDSSATSLTRPMFIIGSSAGLNYSVSTSSFAQSLIGTSTNLVVNATEVIATTTAPQIAFQGNPGETPWYFRSIGNNFYLATSSPTSSATSTNATFGFLSSGVMQLGNYANCNGTNSALGITSGQLLCDSLVSDQRLKKNITPLSNGLSTVLSLKPVTFDWKDLTNHNTSDPREQYGFIAQDVMKILPSAIGTTTPQPGTNGAPAYTLDKTMIIAPIVDAVHSMWKSITDLIAWNNDQDKSLKVLEDQNAAQQKQIDALQTQINNLKK